MLGTTENPQTTQRMQLMGAAGGCGSSADSDGPAADAAYWSTWAMTSRFAPRAANAGGLGSLQPAVERPAKAAQQQLLQAGLYFDHDGGTAGPWHGSVTCRCKVMRSCSRTTPWCTKKMRSAACPGKWRAGSTDTLRRWRPSLIWNEGQNSNA